MLTKAIRKEVRKGGPKVEAGPPGGRFHTRKQLSQTMQIPVDAIFEWLSGASTACLEVNCPGREVFRLPLDKKDVRIGRGHDSCVCLPLANVSRRHAVIRLEGEDFRVEDLGSTNGTFVNGVRVSRCILRDNDQIRIGAARLVFLHHRMRETA